MTVGGATSHQQQYKRLSLNRKMFPARRRPRLHQRSLTAYYILKVLFSIQGFIAQHPILKIIFSIKFSDYLSIKYYNNII